MALRPIATAGKFRTPTRAEAGPDNLCTLPCLFAGTWALGPLLDLLNTR